MEIQEQAKLSFKGVDISDVNFHAIKPRGENMSIDVQCNPLVVISKGKDNAFTIVMEVQVSSEDHFELKMRAVGYFVVDKTINEDIKRIFINSNAVAIMFPYIRSFITTFTSNLGNATGALIIPTQFFEGDIKIIDLNKK